MAVGQSRFAKLLDTGLVFFGIKEGEYTEGLYESNYAEEAPTFVPEETKVRATPPRTVYTGGPSVQVVGGQQRISAISVARDTPPAGTPTYTSPTNSFNAAHAETKDVELFMAHKYSDCQEICDKLKARRVVVLNTSACDLETSRRIQAFVCGYIYAVNGRIQSVIKGKVIIAEPVRGIHTAPEAIERLRRNNFEF
jgi:FtsZ-interacting cell division protein YlmF